MELPKDILGIVYRYVFDYNYSRLMKQYADVWLNGENSYDRIFWDDGRSRFKSWSYCVANWRDCIENYHYVRNFYTHKRSRHWVEFPADPLTLLIVLDTVIKLPHNIYHDIFRYIPETKVLHLKNY